MSTLNINAYALHDLRKPRGFGRWSASALLMVAIHVGVVAVAIVWSTRVQPPGASSPAILIDMAPASAAPKPAQMDVAPGPTVQEAYAPATAPPPPAVPEQSVVAQIAPTPPQEKPEVVAPTEATPEPAPLRTVPPEPIEATPTPLPKPVRKPVQTKTRKPGETPPAPRSTAAPRAERRAPAAASAPSGASSAAAASYRQLLAAHLQRFKQYPSSAKSAGQQGVSMLNFTVSRSGGMLSSRITGSSGHAALDQETLAMIRRAQPLPPFPAGVTQGSLSFTVPIRYAIGN